MASHSVAPRSIAFQAWVSEENEEEHKKWMQGLIDEHTKTLETFAEIDRKWEEEERKRKTTWRPASVTYEAKGSNLYINLLMTCRYANNTVKAFRISLSDDRPIVDIDHCYKCSQKISLMEGVKSACKKIAYNALLNYTPSDDDILRNRVYAYHIGNMPELVKGWCDKLEPSSAYEDKKCNSIQEVFNVTYYTASNRNKPRREEWIGESPMLILEDCKHVITTGCMYKEIKSKHCDIEKMRLHPSIRNAMNLYAKKHHARLFSDLS